MNVIKRDGSVVLFNKKRISKAILKACNEVSKTDRVSESEAKAIADKIAELARVRFSEFCDTFSVESIQDKIEIELMSLGKFALAKRYMIYRYERGLIRSRNTTDDSMLSLVTLRNEEELRENSNKDAVLLSTQRDKLAGITSKDVTKRLLLPKHLVEAFDLNIAHFHDADYFIQKMTNCSLVAIRNMLRYGTVMNGKMIETPKSFKVACTVMTQIIASIASNQYGGQSINISFLGEYLKISYDKQYKRLQKLYGKKMYKKYYDGWKDKFGNNIEVFRDFLTVLMNDLAHAEALELIQAELRDGVQTIQFQINTLMTVNGQSPFVTLFMELNPNDEYIDYTAKVFEEVFIQRTRGLKNEDGVYTTPAFPKLVYVLDEHNTFKGGKYDYLSLLAAECISRRMTPDLISAKKMRELYDGEVFSCMGCRSFLSPWKKTVDYCKRNNEPDSEIGKYLWEGRFNQGVVSLNLPQIGILNQGDEDGFFKMLDERLELCFEALMCRHKSLLGTLSDVSPLHWQHGGSARLKPGETIDELLLNGFSSISLGYIGDYETSMLVKGCSHTKEEGKNFILKLHHVMTERCEQWKEKTTLGFGLYGTPAESLCYRFAKMDEELYGDLVPDELKDDIFGKGFYTNSYHVDVREDIDAFSKLAFESQFQDLSAGGAISYVEVPNLTQNLDAIVEIMKFIYDNIKYAEVNTRADICLDCGFEGEIHTNEDNEWVCPCCGNKNQKRMVITRRTCGYIGSFYWNDGKTREINARKLHL